MTEDKLTRRQKTAEIKKLLKQKFPDNWFSVTWGTGTAHWWVNVHTDLPYGSHDIEIRKIAGKYAGTYYTDFGCGVDDYAPCVSIDYCKKPEKKKK